MAEILPFKTTGMRPLLREALLAKQLVRVWRGNLEHGSFCGYVAGVGREFFLLWVIGDNLGFDGLYTLRHRDVTEIEAPDAHHRFIEKALALKGQTPTWPCDFGLDDVAGVVSSAVARSPVISVHVDGEDEADICYIGRLVAIEDDGFSLQEVNPDAEWLREPSFFAWEEVSTVVCADPYSEALTQIAGKPPELRHGDPGLGRAH